MTLADWLATHLYLQPVADLHARVDGAIATIAIPAAALPDWTAYVEDFHAGVPLLQSSQAAIDLAPVDAALHALLDALSATPLAERTSGCRMAALSPIEDSDEVRRRTGAGVRCLAQ